jgi:hypothetical protein
MEVRETFCVLALRMRIPTSDLKRNCPQTTCPIRLIKHYVPSLARVMQGLTLSICPVQGTSAVWVRDVVLQKFGLRVKARFNPFLDSAGCTIVMRWQHKLKNNFYEDQTLFLETLPRNRSHSLRASFAGRRISLPSKSGELTSSGKKSPSPVRGGSEEWPIDPASSIAMWQIARIEVARLTARIGWVPS